MAGSLYDLEAPIRVVVFGSGPVLERGIKQFMCRLEDHPEIEFLAAFCQASVQTYGAAWRELWHRRKLLAIPLFTLGIGEILFRFLTHPKQELLLKRQLSRLESRIRFVPDIHDPSVLYQVKELKPELGLIYGSPILKPELFEIPDKGTLGIHHGKVPEYRGKKTMFWAMYNGEESAGVTIQKVNAGLDTGEIVKQGAVPIGNRFPGAVWAVLNELGVKLYIQAILEVKHGIAVYQPQVGKKGKLYRDPQLKDILTLWQRQIRNKITGGR